MDFLFAPLDPSSSWVAIGTRLAIGFLLLGLGADWLVMGAARLAGRVGVSSLVVGLTVVAWGTSAPEVMVTLTEIRQGDYSAGLGNVLGSNIANIGLVLGASAIVLPRVLEGRISGREGGWLLVSLGALYLAARDGGISRVDAGLMLALFAVHNLHLLRTGLVSGDSQAATEVLDGRRRSSLGRELLLVLLGAAAIKFGCGSAVSGAEAGALRLGISQRVVGLTVLAIGTSLPELAAGVRSAFAGESDIGLGNVVGSNVFNSIAALGLVCLIHPFEPSTEPAADLSPLLAKDLPIAALFSVGVLALTAVSPTRGGRAKGLVLLIAWATYNSWLVFFDQAPPS